MDATLSIEAINDPRLELMELDLEIERVQAVLERLLERRFAVKRRINSQYSPILQLPVEILSNIFMACYPVNNREQWVSETQLSLGTICSAWRATAWSTSRLWSTISITIHESLFSRDKFILFRDWLARACEQPLSLTFKFIPICFGNTNTDSCHSLADPEVLRDTLDLIARCSERWEHINLSRPLHQSLQTVGYSFEGGFPMLKSIHLPGEAYRASSLKGFHSASQLREVRLLRFDNPANAALSLPQNSNMRLTIDTGSVHDCLHILRHRPNVIHLEIGNLSLPPLGTTFEPVTAPQLQSLEAAHPEYGAGILKLLKKLTAPSLHSLSIVTRDSSWFEVYELMEFISRSRCPLKKLSINCDSVDLVRLLSVTPALTELDLCVNDMTAGDWISLAVDSRCSDIVVPNLTHFTFTLPAGGTLDCDALARMLASRRQPITPGSNAFTRLVEFNILYAESDFVPTHLW